MSAVSDRTPRTLCALCLMPKPLSQSWAWLRLCVECSDRPPQTLETSFGVGRIGQTFRGGRPFYSS